MWENYRSNCTWCRRDSPRIYGARLGTPAHFDIQLETVVHPFLEPITVFADLVAA